MGQKTDIEIAQEAECLEIGKIAEACGIDPGDVERYGSNKAKISLGAGAGREHGKLILVTAITPTPAGEGKTTTTIGLADAMKRSGVKCAAAIREPSLGPVFGVKGGAAGGGYAQVIPMEEINLHFTGDLHAITSANDLLAAMIDNHIQHGDELDIDPQRITWHRCIDMNDRQLRRFVGGLGGRANGVPHEDSFDITAASEVMAVLCLAADIADLKARLGRIVVGYTRGGEPVTAHDLRAEGAMTALLRDAIKPNLVQTLEHTPVFVHGGPFANIAHGCSSVAATKLALRLFDFVVTEAGFGADLGAEKFFDIKCRLAGLRPSAVVCVATVRALKHHGGSPRDALGTPDISALERGIPNLLRHVENMTKLFRLPTVVAVNTFPTDSDEELALVERECAKIGVKAVRSDVWAKGGEGGLDLAREVLALCGGESGFSFAYDLGLGIEEKLDAVCRKVYRAAEVELTASARRQAQELARLGYGGLPICIAKTQYSFSDDPKLLGAPEGFKVTVRDLKLSAGAGFIVALTGDVMTMPGLPKHPAAERIDVDDQGRITGLS